MHRITSPNRNESHLLGLVLITLLLLPGFAYGGDKK